MFLRRDAASGDHKNREIKVLFIQMDLAESGLIQKVFIIGRGADFTRSPSCKSPSKFFIVCLFIDWQLPWPMETDFKFVHSPFADLYMYMM